MVTEEDGGQEVAELDEPDVLDAGAAGACSSFFFYCNVDVPLCRQEAAEGGYAAPSEDVPVYAGSGDDLGG